VPDAFASQTPLREQPFKEIGGQPCWYTGASLLRLTTELMHVESL